MLNNSIQNRLKIQILELFAFSFLHACILQLPNSFSTPIEEKLRRMIDFFAVLWQIASKTLTIILRITQLKERTNETFLTTHQ